MQLNFNGSDTDGSFSRARIRKIPVHDHMIHMVKVDIFTGILFGRLYFIAYLSKNHEYSRKLYS